MKPQASSLLFVKSVLFLSCHRFENDLRHFTNNGLSSVTTEVEIHSEERAFHQVIWCIYHEIQILITVKWDLVWPHYYKLIITVVYLSNRKILILLNWNSVPTKQLIPSLCSHWLLLFFSMILIVSPLGASWVICKSFWVRHISVSIVCISRVHPCCSYIRISVIFKLSNVSLYGHKMEV